MGNRFKEVNETAKNQQETLQERVTENNNTSTPPKKGGIAKSLTTVFGGGFLDNPKIVRQIPFVLFLSLAGLLYNANGYWADDKIRQMNKLTNELKELRTEQISVQSELESVTNEVNIAKQAEAIGLVESRTPPKKIVDPDSVLKINRGE